MRTETKRIPYKEAFETLPSTTPCIYFLSSLGYYNFKEVPWRTYADIDRASVHPLFELAGKNGEGIIVLFTETGPMVRVEIERLPIREATAKYPPETRIVSVIPSMAEGFYNGGNGHIEGDKSLQNAWETTLGDPNIETWGNHVFAVIFKEVPPDPGAPIKKCLVTQAFRPAVLDLLKHAPMNPVSRAHAMNDIKRALPDECKTFEEITAWVELNCEPLAPGSSSPREGAARRARNNAIAFEIDVDESEREDGSCSYCVRRSGVASVPMEVEEVLEYVRGAIADGDGLDEVVDNLCGIARDNANNYSNMDNYGDYDYSNHEGSDSSDYETDTSNEDVEARLRDWLRRNHPDLLEQLGG